MSERKVVDTVTKDGAHVIVKERQGVHSNPIVDIASSISKGEMPNSDQLEQTLHRTMETLEQEKREGRLDEHGRQLASDVERVLQSGEKVISSKGREKILEDIFTESKLSAKENIERGRGTLETQKDTLKPELETLQETGRELYDAIRHVLHTLVKSGDFRYFMVDSLDIFKAMLTELQVTGSEKLSGGQWEPVERVDRTVERTAVPPSAATPSGIEMEMIRMEMEQLRTQEASLPTVTTTFAQTGTVPTTTFGAIPPTTSRAVPATAFGQGTVPVTTTSTVTRTEAHMGRETAHRESEVKKVSDELFDRYCNLFTKMSGDPEYQKAVNNLFHIFEEFRKMKSQIEHSGTTLERNHSQRAFDAAYQFLETFTGQRDLRRFTRTFNRLWDQVKTDETMRTTLHRTWEFNKQVIQNPEYLQSPHRRMEGKLLHEQLRDIITSEKYKAEMDKLFRRANVILDDIRDEETVVDFQKQTTKFLHDFAFNREGKPDLWVMDDSLHDLKLILVPLFKKHLEDVPIDKVEIFSHAVDARIEGLVFSAAEALPEDIKIKIQAVTDINLELDSKDKAVLKVQLQAKHFRPHFKHLKFFYRRKTFPKIEDYGVADVDFAGEGMDIIVNWRIISSPGKPLRAHLKNVKCSLDKLDIHVKGSQTKHSMLDKFVTSMMNKRIKKRLCHAVTQSLGDSLVKADRQINSFFVGQPLDKLRAQADARLKEAYEHSERHKNQGGKSTMQRIKETVVPHEGKRSPVPAHRT